MTDNHTPFEFHREHDGSLSLDAAVFQALGAASTCWESLEGTGIFDSTRAKEIGDTLLTFIRAESDNSRQFRITHTCPICGMELDDETELYEIHLPDCEAEHLEALDDVLALGPDFCEEHHLSFAAEQADVINRTGA